MSLKVDASAMPKSTVEYKEAAGGRVDLVPKLRLRRMHAMFQGPTVTARKNHGAASLRREVI
jgi:hypothetical protein